VLRIIFIVFGCWLAISGSSLWQQEVGVVNARFIARDLGQRSFKAENAQIDKAYVSFASKNTLRSDWAEPEIGLALELDRIGYPPGFVPSPIRENRARMSAERLARASPTAASAWCVLALSEVRASVTTEGLFQKRFRSCFVLGRREIALVETRVHLALAIWGNLPRDLKTSAMLDVASALQERHTRSWMLDRLAYGVAVVAPAQEATALSLISPYGIDTEQRFQKQVLAYRKIHAERSDQFQ
jgi:hypothetical protein